MEVQNALGSINLLGFPEKWPYEAFANELAKGDTVSMPVFEVNEETVVTVSLPVIEVDANTFSAFQDSSYNRFVALQVSNNLRGIEWSTTCPDDFNTVLSDSLYDDPFESLDSIFPTSDLF